MNSKRFLLFIFLIIAPLYAEKKAEKTVLEQLNRNNDHGYTQELNIFAKIHGPWLFKYHQEHRFGSKYRKIWYQEYIFALFYDFTKLIKPYVDSGFKELTFGPGYDLTYQLQRNTLGVYKHVYIDKPLLEAYLTYMFGKWRTITRLRGEYQAFTKPHYHSHGIFRYRSVIFAPWKFTCRKINPYVSNESFFRANSFSKSHPTGLVGGFYQNRFRLGFNIELESKKLNADVFWQWRVDKQKPEVHPYWWNTYYYGMTLNLNY